MATSSIVTTLAPSALLTAEPTSTPASISTGTPIDTTTLKPASTTIPGSSTFAASSSHTFSEKPPNKTVYVTVTASPKANNDDTIGGTGLNGYALIGISIAGFLLLVIIGLIAFYTLRRRRRRKRRMLMEIPSSTGSRGHIMEEKSSSDAAGMYERRGSDSFNASSSGLYEMEVPAPKAVVTRPELGGRSAPRDLERGLSLIDSRHIMSRGRPVRRGPSLARYSTNDLEQTSK